MQNKGISSTWILLVFVVVFPSVTLGLKISPDPKLVEAESQRINQLIAAGDVGRLIEMLPTAHFKNQVTIAECLGEIGDERAIPILMRLNETNGGWLQIWIEDYDYSGAFAVAICKILTRKLSEHERIEALFELLEGKGPAVPEPNELIKIAIHCFEREVPINLGNNYRVGARIATELEKYNDPNITAQLRKSENRGVVRTAVWMEVRDMNKSDAIARCVQIAKDEDYDQRYGAIMCLARFGNDAIPDLNGLASQGYSDAIDALTKIENPSVAELLAWHLLNNRNSFVRARAVGCLPYNPNLIPVLIKALYDPHGLVRRSAILHLYSIAYKRSEFDPMLEEAMLIALKHPDEEIRKRAQEILRIIGSIRSSESVPAPPPFRSDLEAESKIPLSTRQKVKKEISQLEKEVDKFMKMGPPQEAVRIYQRLLELKPGYKPYEAGIKKARSHIDAAADTNETWYPDAPYIGVKGRYSYLLSQKPRDISTLKDEFELADYLSTTFFPNWSGIFSGEPKGEDQFVKAIRLYEHIIDNYPLNEYYVLFSVLQARGLRYNLYRNTSRGGSEYPDISTVAIEKVVDTTDARRNQPLPEEGGRTRAQLDFERYLLRRPGDADPPNKMDKSK